MRSVIIALLLLAALVLGINTAVEGVYDGRTLLAVIYVLIAWILHSNRRRANS